MACTYWIYHRHANKGYLLRMHMRLRHKYAHCTWVLRHRHAYGGYIIIIYRPICGYVKRHAFGGYVNDMHMVAMSQGCIWGRYKCALNYFF